MPFTESNTVEAMIRDLLCGALPIRPIAVGESPAAYETAGLATRGIGAGILCRNRVVHRQQQDVFVEDYMRKALIPLDPEHRGAAAEGRRGDLQAAGHRPCRA